ncbi:MAG: lysine--tRNA ligase [Halobacteria archaeon]|nr:lysine--tRNA ligase [Halobacteria archaeon]
MTSDYSTEKALDTDFWADEVAQKVVYNSRNPLVRGAVSPSGIPHIGNFNEILRGYFVARALRDRGLEVEQVFTNDDRDPLRKIPDKLADLDGEIVELDEGTKEDLEEYLGMPYVSVPDPFGCCDSWAVHFSSLLEKGAEQLDIPVNFYSTSELYDSGRLLDATRTVLSDVEKARDIISEFQRTVGENYIPFMPICAECGKITATPLSVDPEREVVEYECRDVKLAGKYEIKGCGHRGEASFTEGKLPWRFEWPAQWLIFDTGFEPFGKEHAEGSWKSGTVISREIFNHEPPEHLVYEFFLVDGAKMSASKGNIYTVDEMLEMLEPEVFKYFFSLDPSKQRDFSLEGLEHLVNEFDRIESIHLGKQEPADEKEKLYAQRVYPMLVSEVRDRVRVPYTFAAMVGVAKDTDAITSVLQRSGHLPQDPTEQQVEDALRRVELARNWARRLDNQYYVKVLEDPPEIEFDPETREGFEELADFIEEGHSAEEIQSKIFETARERDIDVGDFFSAGYRLFLGQDSGPKLGPLLAALDRDFVVERLRSA